MATVRLIVIVLVGGLVVLLGVQNLSLALPLVFFGGSSQALPLGVWLVGAIALGALTTLASTALLGAAGSTANRSAAYKYRPQSFYEPTEPSPAARAAAGDSRTRANAPPPSPPPGPRTGGQARTGGDAAGGDPSWQAWTSLKSPGQWNDWESLSQAPKPETAGRSFDSPDGGSSVSGLVDGVTTWFSSSKQRAKQQQRVNESLRALDDDWGDVANRPYPAPGVSPVQDSLDDISQGWDQTDPNRPFEADQAPRRVYRDGSIYSYSYRGDEAPDPSDGQVDNIYAPPDDVYRAGPPGNDGVDGIVRGDRYPDAGPEDYADDGYQPGPGSDGSYGQVPEASDYGDRPSFDDDDAPLGEPEVAEDGVVDADYRVIEAPYTAAAQAAAAQAPWPEAPGTEADDDWDEADDALTP
jgi:hypothetical protein